MNNRYDDDVSSAIAEARTAARAAGFNDIDDERTRPTDPSERPKVSYAFDLTGLDNAPDIANIEAALEQIPGVRARLVYPNATAWVTAPDTVDPNDLVRVIEGFDIGAVLTDGSLRRRIMHSHSGEGPLTQRPELRPTRRRSSMSWKFRRHLEEEARIQERARLAGFLNNSPESLRDPDARGRQDILFTARDLLTPTRLIITIVLTVPVLALTYFQSLQFDGWQWLTLGLALPVVTWGAWPFHRAMVGGVRRGLTALDAASSVAIIAATIWSLMMLIFTPAGDLGWQTTPSWFAFNQNRIVDGELFLDVACGMTVLLLVGRLLTMRSRVSLLDELDARRPSPHELVEVVQKKGSGGEPGGGSREKIPLQEVNVGDDIMIEQGQIVPVDGQVVGGSCMASPGLFGSGPEDVQDVKVNSYVYAGTKNLQGRIKVRAAYTGHGTRLTAIRRWVSAANQKQIQSTLLSTRTAAMLIPAAFGIAILDFMLWTLIAGNFNAAFATSLAVLASVAPVAIALSPALAIRNGIESAARNGVLIRDGSIVRVIENIDTVIFNRVGTLAETAMAIETVTADRGENPELVLRVAGALAMESDHPVSRALVKAAREARDFGTGGEEVPHWIDVSHFEIGPEGDFRGLIELPVTDDNGHVSMQQMEARLWRPLNMSQLHGRLAAAAISGGTPLVVRWKGRDRGVITLRDTVKDDAEIAIQELSDMGVETMMLSRDTYPVARRIADRIGIDHVLAGIAPGKKAQAVRSVHTRGATVGMVGDVSVLSSLRVADVGILMGTDSQVDRIAHSEHPDVDAIVLRPDVTGVPQLIVHCRRICRIIDRNIVFAWTYNGLAVLASIAGVLHPMAATVLMLGSSLIIEARSNRARVFRR
ncbi:heavy metal translocating P-type ATPase [Corynebacterium testudinoris]|uniref:Cation transport ATPase n=1 Tax=Corynebacterium testudinoris TaxID=136857 RepID=A0A0G3H4Y5_9CORY|nr:HAD-IC family P-type ATPase [Corynebacterium testudinoris]AKK07795.1 cation transport ATPase [Corynebacterium testudinoris]